MFQLLRSRVSLLSTILFLTACSPAVTGDRRGDSPRPPVDADRSRALVMVTDVEVGTLAPKIQGPTNPARTTRIFNAGLAIVDGADAAHPYAAEALPRLDTDTWSVFPDGRMETVWKLRPGLAWHDGQPLTSDDFVFAHGVYSDLGLGVFTPSPQNLITGVSAPDPRTVTIGWSIPYVDADRLLDSDFGPLPRHLLEEAFTAYKQDAAAREAFLALPYWTTEYVGNGPYRLTSWERGSHMEATAFDAHPLGKPKIGRVIVRFVPDANVTFTNVLAESVTYVMSQALRFEQAVLLEREWDANKRGVVMYRSAWIDNAGIQFRPEYAGFPELADVRVRRAIAHGIDRVSLNDALFQGRAAIIHSYIIPEQPEFAEVERSITKYEYDPRRVEQLMTEAGFQRDSDGYFTSQERGRLQPTIAATAGLAELERLLAILTNTWQRAGIDFQSTVIPSAQARDNQVRSTFPGLLVWGAAAPRASIHLFITPQIGTAQTRWGGQNRGGWSNAEFDRLENLSTTTLDPRGRTAHIVAMAKLLSDEVPVYPFYPNLGSVAHLSALKGPEGDSTHWNMQEWEWRS